MRIAISGCPNACTSPMLNEIGIMGRIRPLRTPGLCTGCGTCVQVLQGEGHRDKKRYRRNSQMTNVCSAGSVSAPARTELLKADHRHFLVSVGGRRGRHPQNRPGTAYR